MTSRLVIYVEVDIDPTKFDPEDVAEELLWQPEVFADSVNAALVTAKWDA